MDIPNGSEGSPHAQEMSHYARHDVLLWYRATILGIDHEKKHCKLENVALALKENDGNLAKYQVIFLFYFIDIFMNKRFIWNFELNGESPLPDDLPHSTIDDTIRWEARFFWPESQIITLHGLDDTYLCPSYYKIKRRQDVYYLLPNSPLNIKLRRDSLLYKPLLARHPGGVGYGKKIILEEAEPGNLLPGETKLSAQSLLKLVKEAGTPIQIVKEVCIYSFETTPKCKLELARLTIGSQVFFSVSIESRGRSFVELYAKHLLKDAISCDYVGFLASLKL